jgi:hypothetical protein
MLQNLQGETGLRGLPPGMTAGGNQTRTDLDRFDLSTMQDETAVTVFETISIDNSPLIGMSFAISA